MNDHRILLRFYLKCRFVVGYCLDYNEFYRDMNHIAVINQVKLRMCSISKIIAEILLRLELISTKAWSCSDLCILYLF